MNNPYLQIIMELNLGRVIAYPTESVFGLGADPQNPAAIDQLLHFKQRQKSQGLILISDSFSSISHFITPLNLEEQAMLLQLHLGYTHTWLVPFSPNCPDYLYGEFDTIAIRITQHPVAQKICEDFGPIVSTSANIHGYPAATTPQQVHDYFKDKVYIVEGEVGHLNRPTRIIDLKSRRIIRA